MDGASFDHISGKRNARNYIDSRSPKFELGPLLHSRFMEAAGNLRLRVWGFLHLSPELRKPPRSSLSEAENSSP